MAYIYEYIRTRGVEPLHFEEHYLHLDALMNKLFYTHLNFSRKELRDRICHALQMRNYSPTAINAIYVKVAPYATEPEIEIEEIFYESFSLRALRPQGYICPVGCDLIMENSSAREALIDLNRTMAQITQDDVAIWVNSKDEIIAIDGASVIAVFDDEVRFSSHGSGVMYNVAYKAMLESEERVTCAPIYTSELSLAKEIMCIDHRGIMVLESFDDHFYIDIVASKIAKRVNESEK